MLVEHQTDLVVKVTARLTEDDCKPYQVLPGRYAKISVTNTGIGMDDST